MKITKLGHCALVLEVGGVKLLTDPGNWTIEAQEKITGLDAVLITHEHQDHYHVDSIKAIIANNPTAILIGNKAMSKLIGEQIADTAVTVVGDGQTTMVKDILIEGFGTEHALVYPSNMGLCENTGYFVANKFYFPGDNFYIPMQKDLPAGRQVDILALPVAGPWMKIADAVDFAKAVKARVALGVHDAMIVPPFRPFVGMLLKMFVPETDYVALQDGETREF